MVFKATGHSDITRELRREETGRLAFELSPKDECDLIRRKEGKDMLNINTRVLMAIVYLQAYM